MAGNDVLAHNIRQNFASTEPVAEKYDTLLLAPRVYYLHIRICALETFSFFIKIFLDCNRTYVVNVCLFDENMLIHINHELADYAGRESDPSKPV
jgi:hypothetical protein